MTIDGYYDTYYDDEEWLDWIRIDTGGNYRWIEGLPAVPPLVELGPYCSYQKLSTGAPSWLPLVWQFEAPSYVDFSHKTPLHSVY